MGLPFAIHMYIVLWIVVVHIIKKTLALGFKTKETLWGGAS